MSTGACIPAGAVLSRFQDRYKQIYSEMLGKAVGVDVLTTFADV